ncbi:MAG: formylglycine-generating enzyme family protein [Cyanobacteria bacterium P01_F01_bin.53]
MSEIPKSDLRDVQFADGFAEAVHVTQIGRTINYPASLTLYRNECTNDSYTEELGNGVTLTLMLIPAEQFMMGDAEAGQHQVNMPQFLMGRYPVTQAQWRAVKTLPMVEHELDADPAAFKGDNHPVDTVTWYDAVEFCQRLSMHTGRNYHLPSEAQWEYACRAGTDTDYHFGPQITSEVANYGQNENTTTAVGRYPANRWGLHDMHGNVWEWCQDQWHQNYEGAPNDGSAWEDREDNNTRMLRGGSWDFDPRYCRSACRFSFTPDYRDNDFGFRVVCSAPRILP